MPKLAKKQVYVAVFLEDRAYGGPEEGGWWYDTGDLVRTVWQGPASQAEAAEVYAERLNKKLETTLNHGRRPISSVLSEGRYRALVCNEPPASWPEQRPHYE